MELSIFFIVVNTFLGILNMWLYKKKRLSLNLLIQALLWVTVGIQIGKLVFYFN